MRSDSDLIIKLHKVHNGYITQKMFMKQEQILSE